jgi:ribosomal protein S18 acetylase RimI-like enzyme
MAEPTRELTGLRPISPNDVDVLVAMFAALPDRDKTFVEDRVDRDTVARWPLDPTASRWIVGTGDSAHGYLGVIPHAGWSSHVGDLRLVVAGDHRRKGLGRALAQHGLLTGVALGLRKITVSVAADKEGDIAMFTSIGFRPEALLEDHIRDRHGAFHDLVLLSHDVAEVGDDLSLVGVSEAVGLGTPST